MESYKIKSVSYPEGKYRMLHLWPVSFGSDKSIVVFHNFFDNSQTHSGSFVSVPAV